MYNGKILSICQQPYHMGPLPDADAIGQDGIPGEGPFMTIYLKVQKGLIQQAWFETYGCPAAIACGSWLSQWVEGKSPTDASALEDNHLSMVLGGLPLGKEHCARIAVRALASALRQL